MKVKVIKVFFDDNGLHKKGEIVDVKLFDGNLMEKVVEKTTEKKSIKKTAK